MTDSRRFFGILAFSGLAFAVCGLLRADTVTPTPTPSPSPTVTMTATEGPGSFSYTVYNSVQVPLATPFVVPANTGNSLQINYTVATALAPGSELVFDFPPDLCVTPGVQPSAANFYTVNEYQQYFTYAASPSDNGYTVTVTSGTNSAGDDVTIPAGTILIFTYGQGPNSPGFAVSSSTTQTSEPFMVWANPGPQSVQPGVGLVPAPSPILVYSPTVSPTVTASPTASPSASPTLDCSPTTDPTNTASPTETPVGTPVASFKNMHSYPNPFDLRLYHSVTIAFPPTSESVSITIFSLAGNPVCEIPSSEIQASMGVAQWNGVDDYGRVVPGGLYFIRLRTPSVTVIHKMTVFH